MIVDARAANRRFKDAPGVQLCTAESFSRFEVEPGPQNVIADDSQLDDGTPPLYIALSDVKDAFHRIKQPDWLARYFCFMPIEARHVNLGGCVVDGHLLKGSDLVYPMPGSLCMGFSWSLFFCQRINERLMESIPRLLHSEAVKDRGPPFVITADHQDKPGHYVYVDNLGVLSKDLPFVEEAANELTHLFTSQGLILHPAEIKTGQVKTLGVELDGQKLRTRVLPERLHKLRAALCGLLHRGRCSGRTLEVVIGHATFCGLVERKLLSVFHTCYKFIEKCYQQVTPLWKSVIDELRAFSALAPALESDWRRSWNTHVLSSDASEEGYGIVAGVFDKDQVAQVGRMSERGRFKRSGGHNARESALTAAGFIQDDVTGQWVEGDLGSADYLDAAGWELDSRFPEVPADMLQKQLWTPKVWGSWRRKEHIGLLEARTLVKSLQRVANTSYGFGIWQLLLVDSMTVALSFERSRSRSFQMLRLIRRYAAYCIGCNLATCVRWIPSELNSADGPSRISSQIGSKSLSHRIPVCHGHQAQPPSRKNPSATGAKHPEEGGTEEETARGGSSQLGIQGSKFTNAGQTRFGEAASYCEVHGSPLCARAIGCHNASPSGQLNGPRQRGVEFNRECSATKGQGAKPRSQAAPPAAQVRRGEHGGTEARPHPPGEEGRHSQDGAVLPGRDERLQDIRGSTWNRPGQPGVGRCCGRPCDDGLLEPSVFGRPRLPSRRQADSCSDALPTPLQPCRSREVAPLVAVTERVEKAEPWKVAESHAACGVVCHRHGAHQDVPAADGPVPHDGPEQLFSPKRVDPVQGVFARETGGGGQRQLVSPPQPGREAGEVPDRGVRRQHPARLSLYEALGPCVVCSTEEGGPRGAVVGLRLLPLLDDVLPCLPNAAAGNDTVPTAAFRAVHRQSLGQTEPCGSSEKRAVEKLQKREPLREVSQTGCQLRPAASSTPTSLRRGRSSARGRDAGAAPPAGPTCRRRELGKYVGDYFSGCGGVAKQCRKLGYRAKECDILHGPGGDLTSSRVLRHIRQDINAGKVLAAMLAPPCTSFSIARDRAKVIRTKEQPWGVDPELLNDKEKHILHIGNLCFRSALRVVGWLHRKGIPWILENPFTSKCWWLPPVRKYLEDPACIRVATDFCQFGTPWRKRTLLLCGNLDSQDVDRLQRQCQGPTCSRSGRPHFQLTGSNAKGIPWTRVAQPYPAALCKALAFSLTCPSHYNPSQW